MNEKRRTRLAFLIRVLLASVFFIGVVSRYEHSVVHAQDGERDSKPIFGELLQRSQQAEMQPSEGGITIDINSPDAISRLNELAAAISVMPTTAGGHPSRSMEIDSISNGDFEQGRTG